LIIIFYQLIKIFNQNLSFLIMFCLDLTYCFAC